MIASTVIELKGHIIDSLTLAKVIDVIQASQATYRVNFIDVGYEKNDVSITHITISLPNEAELNSLLAQLVTYGAKPIQAHTAGYTACTQDGVLPENALQVESSLMRVFIGDEWIPLEGKEELHTVVIFDPLSKTAFLKQLSRVKKGEMVVTVPNDIQTHLLLK